MAYTLPFVFFFNAFGPQLHRWRQLATVAAGILLTMLWLACSAFLVVQMFVGASPSKPGPSVGLADYMLQLTSY